MKRLFLDLARDQGPEPAPAAGAVECQSCPVGAVSGVGKGQFCPFIVRQHESDTELYSADELADYIWFVKAGVVSLKAPGGHCEIKYPNSFIGIEALDTGRYRATAHTLAPTTLCGATREGFAQWMKSNAEPLCAALCRAFAADHS